jgi:hypothetical protein
MHADVYVSIFYLNRRSVWPNFQLDQIFRRYFLKGSDPRTRDQEPGLPVRNDLNGISLGYIANRLRPNFRVGVRPTGSYRCRIFGISDLMWTHTRNLTSSAVPSRKGT